MPLNISVPPYELTSVLSSDNNFSHYNATDYDGNPHIITELYPTYMANRSETGSLVISSRFTQEFATTVEKFEDMAYAMKRLNEVSIAKVEAVITANNTAYVVRKVNTNPTLESYMGDQRMAYEESYEFMRPLIHSLVQASGHSLYFYFSDEDLRVNRYGQLTMDCMFGWGSNLTICIISLAKLYYRLVTGQAYNVATMNAIENPEFGIPPRLRSFIMEILSGDVLYGSMSDFYKKFRFVMDLSASKKGGEASTGPVSGMRLAIIILSALLVSAMGILVYFVAIPVYKQLNPNLADPSLIKPPQSAQAPEPWQRSFAVITDTHPGDANDILAGAFLEAEGYIYCRSWKNNKYCLIKIDGGGGETLLADGVRPAFITVSGGYVYFCDGLKGYRICRVKTSGGGVEVISENAALNLIADGDNLYYTNHDDRDYLYILDLITMESAPYIKNAAYELRTDGNNLYFINGSRDFYLYMAEPGDPPALARLSDVDGHHLRFDNGMLYYIDFDEGLVRRITADGQPVGLGCEVKAGAFDVKGEWLVIVDAVNHYLYAYNLHNGALSQISGARSAYARIMDDGVYAVDFNYANVTRKVELK